MADTSDQALIDRTRAGSTAAFDALMCRYQELVYRISFGYTGNQDDSLDVTQNVFIKVYQRLDSFKGSGSFKGWLLRIARNESIDWIRHCARDRQSEELTNSNTPSYDPAQEVEMYRSENRDKLIGAMGKLSPKQRDAVVLRYFQNMSIREISTILGCSEGTTKSILFRSIQRLRNLTVPQWSES